MLYNTTFLWKLGLRPSRWSQKLSRAQLTSAFWSRRPPATRCDSTATGRGAVVGRWSRRFWYCESALTPTRVCVDQPALSAPQAQHRPTTSQIAMEVFFIRVKSEAVPGPMAGQLTQDLGVVSGVILHSDGCVVSRCSQYDY